MITPTVDWFNDRPLNMYTVCSRLIEAVEEREKFFALKPNEYHPLALPAPPCCNYDLRSEYLNDCEVWYLRTFSQHLFNRVLDLLRNSFFHGSFGTWAKIWPFGMVSQVKSYLTEMGADCDIFFSEGVQAAIKPHCFENMRYFYTVADILNRCTLYPAPSVFFSTGKKDAGNVFGVDGKISCTDMISGNSDCRDFQPAGVKFTLSDGSTFSPHPGWLAGYRAKVDDEGNFKHRYSWKTSDVCVFYQTGGQEQTYNELEHIRYFPMRGEFKIKMRIDISFQNADGYSRVNDEQILSVRPDSGGDKIDFSLYASTIDKCMHSSTSDNKGESYASATYSCDRIMLNAENFLPLPYKYLNLN